MVRRIEVFAAALFAAAASLSAQGACNRSLLAAAEGGPAGGPCSAAVASARNAVVHVLIEVAGPNPFRIERPSSGVMIAADGLVATLWSLVREADGAADKRLFVRLSGSADRLPAQIVGRAEASDLALLRVEAEPGRKFEYAPLAASDPRPGDPAVLLALHDGEDHVAFGGVAAQASGDIAIEGGVLRADAVFLLDAAIEARGHGAGVFGLDGALLGVANAACVAPAVSEPSLADLLRPSFGFVLPARSIRALCAEAGIEVESRPLPPPSPEAAVVARVAPTIVAVYGSKGGAGRVPIGTADPYATRRRPGVGSGVVIDPSGLVFTNRHLVRDADKIRVTALDGATWEADLVHEDDPTNTALLRLRLPPGKQVPAVARGSLASVEVGETVLALGNPEGRALTVRRGVVSAVRGKRLQIDAGIGNQNGGGAIVSLRGELLAVVDGGKVDWVEVAYAHRGEQAKVETGLDLSPGIDDLGERYRVALDRYGSTVPASAGEAPPAAAHPVAAVVRKAGAAMLNVRVEQDLAALAQEDNPFAPPASRAQPRGLGSGVVIDESGLALTNWHVVDEATEPDGSAVPGWIVRAYLRDGRSYVADVLSISREEDLALIRLRLPPEERLTAIELGSSAHLSVGDLAVAIGNPHGRADTVTAGVITAKNQAIRVKGRWRKLKHLLETDAAINAGNSGGALLDAAGRLIGINSAGGAAHAVTGYAIGVDHVREKLLGLLLSPEKLRSAYAGIEVIDQDGKVLVRAVDRHGPAAGAGVEPGDVVRAVAGRPVCCSVAFALAWRELADERVELSLERAGKSRVVALTPMSAAAWAVFRQTGLVVREVSIVDEPDAVQNAAVAGYRRFTGDPTAAPRELPGSLVRVERVHPETAARVAIRPGDFVFALQVVDEATGAAELMHLQRTAELQRGCNQLATYEGSTLTAWIVRGAEVQVVELPAKRVPW